MNPRTFDSSKPTVVVFSHPNHELALYGLLQRLRPRPTIVYLTDGECSEREEQTREGLARIGLLDRASFLGHSEQSLYDALLRRDADFFRSIADQLSALLSMHSPEQVLCDAIEFYNPLHDMTVPIVRAARCREPSPAFFEVPLVHQEPGPGEQYRVQRPPLGRSTSGVEILLTEAELQSKIIARDKVYTLLAEQMGSLLTDLTPEEMGTEVVVPATMGTAVPGPDVTLRYEWRSALLRNTGKIREQISYSTHYVPVSNALMARTSSRP